MLPKKITTIITEQLAKIFFIAAYIALLVLFTDATIEEIINIKELLIVIIGSVVFIIPYLFNNKKKTKTYLCQTIFLTSIISGFFTSFILLMLDNKKVVFNDNAIKVIFTLFRPALYGALIATFFYQKPESIGSETEDCTKKSALPKNPNEANRKISISEFFKKMGLSNREAEVARLAVIGLSNKEIAMELFIAPTTVKRHMYVIFGKLSIKKREDLKNIYNNQQN